MRAAAALAGPAPELDAEGPSSPCLGRVAGPDAEHRVVPLPHCPECGGAAALSGATWDEADPLAGWVDPVTGVIPELSVDAGTAGLVVVTAAPPHVIEEDGSLRRLPVGWGKGLTPSDAVFSAVGEAIERYSASLADPARIVWASPDELDGDRLDPHDLPLYSDEQYARPGFPFARFDSGIAHPWVRGEWLGGGEVWVPAVLAFLSLTIEPAHLFAQGTSNGLAAATSLEEAARRAALELVERDAMLAAWLTGTPGTRLLLDDALDPSLAAVLDGLGAEVELYALPTAACGHAVLCLARGDGESWPGATIGLAADLDPATALRRAIVELGQTGPYLRRLMETGAIEVPPEPAAVATMLDHAAFYFPAERAAAFDFLRRGESIALTRFLERPDASLDVRAAIVDVTAPDVAVGPFRVARAISPDLQPLTYGHGLEREPVRRIRDLGLAPGAPPVHPVW